MREVDISVGRSGLAVMILGLAWWLVLAKIRFQYRAGRHLGLAAFEEVIGECSQLGACSVSLVLAEGPCLRLV